MTTQSLDQLGKSLPSAHSVALIMQQSPSSNPWIDSEWEAVGILTLDGEAEGAGSRRELILEQAEVKRYLYRGFSLRLHPDECESYYHNLLAPSPCGYIVASVEDDGTPQPLLITLSFDEAHAYLEGDENLYTVSLPADIYRWAEAYVLAHYVPQQRKKRKRQDWRQTDPGPRP